MEEAIWRRPPLASPLFRGVRWGIMACNFKEASDVSGDGVNRLAGVSVASLEASRDLPDGTHWINDKASSLC